MAEGADGLARLSEAWDDAAAGYERYFVPRFAPWVRAAVGSVAAARLPPGPIVVPCCGTFPELSALLREHPGRDILGVDLSPGMVRMARERAAGSERVRVVVGDATALCARCPDGCAAVVSVFGLQQLPDPRAALANWTHALRPGGRLSVVYWPTPVEDDGPFAVLDRVLSGSRPATPSSWQQRLAATVTSAACGGRGRRVRVVPDGAPRCSYVLGRDGPARPAAPAGERRRSRVRRRQGRGVPRAGAGRALAPPPSSPAGGGGAPTRCGR